MHRCELAEVWGERAVLLPIVREGGPCVDDAPAWVEEHPEVQRRAAIGW